MLFEEIRAAKGVGTYLKYLKKLSRIKVLILDDFLIQPIEQVNAGFLVDVIEEKQQLGSIINTTEYPVSKWHHQLPDPIIADALCDRLAHDRAYIFNLIGDSMQRKNSSAIRPK